MAVENDQEARTLQELFAAPGALRKGEFAARYRVPGGASMVSQHLAGHRPMSVDAVIAYARGFGVPIRQISPRVASLVAEAASMLGEPPCPVVDDEPQLAACLAALATALAAVPPSSREALALNLAGWARDGGKGPWQQVVQALLDGSSGKQRRAA